jgi:alpha-L-rhamnosidase
MTLTSNAWVCQYRRIRSGAGTYFLESFEPYTFRYLKVMSLAGACSVGQIYLRENANDAVWDADFRCSDERMNHIFEAAGTLSQNAIESLWIAHRGKERDGFVQLLHGTSRIRPHRQASLNGVSGKLYAPGEV